MPAPDPFALDTLLVHQHRKPDAQSGAVASSPVLSTTFARDAEGELIGPHLYGRYGNPTRASLERVLADLEGGAEALCAASGSAAAHLLLQAVPSGGRLVVDHGSYFGLRRLMRTAVAERGVDVREIDFRAAGALAAAVEGGADLVWCESPTNPMMRVVDLAAVVAQAHQAGAAVLVDNTLATPILQRPIDFGADFVLHSSTKYFGGHSDVLGGALIAADAAHPMWSQATQRLTDGGAVSAPFDCWLIARSLPTLGLRVRAQSASAQRLATFLSDHPAVSAVHYPGLESHPDHDLAAGQMSGPGAMLSFELAAGEAAAARVASKLRHFTAATSLGAVHSLVEHRARVEGPDGTTPNNLLRLSIGIERPADLERDLEMALAEETP